MTIRHEVSVAIDRPIEVVFERLVDVEAWPAWLIASGIVAVQRPDAPAPLHAGTRFVIQQRLAGVRTSSIDATVTEFDAPTRLAIRGRDADGVTIELDATLTSVGPGCRLDWRVAIGLPLRYRMFESMAGPQARRAADLDLEAFRRQLASRP